MGTGVEIPGHILNGWKEVGSYLHASVRAVQRWEVELGLPVRRPWGKRRSAVIANIDELDLWIRTRTLRKFLRPSEDSLAAGNGQPNELIRTARELQKAVAQSRRELAVARVRLVESIRQLAEQGIGDRLEIGPSTAHGTPGQARRDRSVHRKNQRPRNGRNW